MNFKILHLSDIHISSTEDNNHKMLRNNLIKYLKDKVKDIDVIVVTGDIVDRYDKEAFSLGKSFLEEILCVVGLSKDKLVIVPGNHDIERSSMIERILDRDELGREDFLSKSEKYIKLRMDAYAQFIDSLELQYGNDNRYGYGVRLIDKSEMKVCFSLFNSAWSSKGSDDYRHLFIGREQLEYNRSKIEEQENVDCVISVMHHPISWFDETESEMLKDYLLDENKLDSAIVLHGHIHNAVMQAEEFPAGKIVSLISGVGYPKSDERLAGQPKISSCRFSVYTLDMDKKRADCFVLSSNEKGIFVPDNQLYHGSEDGHYIMYWGYDREPSGNAHEKYIDLDPIPVTKCWSGREEELELFSRGDANVIAISGVGGQGKTALAAEFLRRDAEGGEVFEQRVWVDCRELQDTMHVKLLKILDSLTNGKENEILYKDEQFRDTLKRFLRYVKQHKVMAVFDNIDAYVTFDSEELVGELKNIIDGVLTLQTGSLIILTCRTSLYDSRANFRSIHLHGLKEPEGILYFKKRNISVEESENMNICKNIIRITKGHPWWIGLICGQIIADRVSLKDYWEQNRDSLLTHNSQLEHYFSTIWNKLGDSSKGEIRQKIIRFLVESARPLTIMDLSNLLNENRNQISKAVNHLYHISLVIEHDGNGGHEKSYQIHPLVREYIHKLYNSEIQKPFVHQLLELLIGKKMYNIIFGSDKKVQKNIQCDVKDIIDSIETCLNSRNVSDALDLMTYSYKYLCQNGYLAEFLELSGRIIDVINWSDEQITYIKNRSEFLCEYLDVLAMQEYQEERVRYYLSLYEKNCEKNTVAYSGYLATRAAILWRIKDYPEAYLAIEEYEHMKDKYGELRSPTDMDNLKGLILRDCGKIVEALEVFESNLESDARLGNIARCYQKQKKYDLALDKLRECLNGLEGKESLEDNVNRGYAYFWIAEIYYQDGKNEEANVFMTLCQEIWKEYAPGLLPETSDLLDKLESINIEMKPNQKEEISRAFMMSN